MFEGQVTVPRRVSRRTVSRGVMVRKKASREQVQVAVTTLWQRSRQLPPLPCQRAVVWLLSMGVAQATLRAIRCSYARLPVRGVCVRQRTHT